MAFRKLICIISIIITFICIPYNIHGQNVSTRNTIRVGDYDSLDFSIYEGLDYELLRCTFKDGVYIDVVTVDLNKRKYSIQVTAETISYIVIKLMKRSLDDIQFIIHNHPIPQPWSSYDILEYKKLVFYGFKGKFLLWSGGKIFDIVEVLK